jgi:predicted O-methyltransferase YrrM
MYLYHRYKSKKLQNIKTIDLPKWLMEALLSKAIPYGVTPSLKYLNGLMNTHQNISVRDLGAGSRKMGKNRSISDIAKYSTSNYKELLFLSRLAFFKNPESVLELGTSLGTTAVMLSNVAQKADVVSVEGCPRISDFARKNSKSYVNNNLHIVNAEFEFFLKQNNKTYDLIFIDGNHRHNATLRLFNATSDCLNPDGVIIIDDIYWSLGMHKAWNKIKNTPGFIALDLFHSGILIKGGNAYHNISLML